MSEGDKEMPAGSYDSPAWVIDLHVHTAPRSSDSALSPDDLGRRSIELGLAAVCVTEHNHVWHAAAARELSERHGIPVVRGMEASTDAGHVLVFGLDEFRPEMFSAERLLAIVRSEGGAAILAHPLREPRSRRPWDEVRDMFDALEALNGDENGGSAGVVAGIAARLGMRTTGGSDAHSLAALGRCATVFRDPVTDDRSLVLALRNGRFDPVDLSGRQPV
jgi:hypothetical protein